jgi:hypothetical protein
MIPFRHGGGFLFPAVPIIRSAKSAGQANPRRQLSTGREISLLLESGSPPDQCAAFLRAHVKMQTRTGAEANGIHEKLADQL